MPPNEVLIKAYKNTIKLIKENPENKENIINEYIDLVDIISSQETSSKSTELSKMFKNPMEIAIYNNFQRYADSGNYYGNGESYFDSNRMASATSPAINTDQFLANVQDSRNRQ